MSADPSLAPPTGATAGFAPGLASPASACLPVSGACLPVAGEGRAVLPRLLFVHAADAASCQAHAELRSRGYAVAWIGHAAEIAAGTAFAPDVVIADAQSRGDDLITVLDQIGHDGRICPVIELRPPGEYPSAVLGEAMIGEHPLVGSLERTYKIGALTAILASLATGTGRSEDAGGDRRMIAALLAGSRLLPNLHYEFLPKIDLTADQVAGYEALARLRNIPGVNPEWLFAAMTDAGIEAAATMKAVTAALDLWLALSVEQRSAPVAINCSQAVLADPLFQAALGDELRRRGVASNGPGRGVLIIEITEDARPVDTQRLVRDMNGLRDLGVVFSLDDFGKGATNFDRVFTLPIAELKIDKDFFGHCARHVHELGILREVVRSCHARGLSTVVEGVETEEHLAIARDLGARCAQGFYWGRPMAAGSFAHVRVI